MIELCPATTDVMALGYVRDEGRYVNSYRPFCFAGERNPPSLIIDDWIEARLEERRFAALPAGEEHDFAMLAGVLRTEAEIAGYDRSRHPYDRQHHHKSTPLCRWRKKEADVEAIGRSQGGRSAKSMLMSMVVDVQSRCE